MISPSLSPAAFLDRDGVINEDQGYVGRPADFMLLPGAAEGLALLSQAGFVLVVITNQSGIARGYYSEDDYEAVTAAMIEQLAARGVSIARVAHCPHFPETLQDDVTGRCRCRKPRPGMILDAAQDLRLDLTRSILIGDKPIDIQAGRAARVACCYLIDSAAKGSEIDADGVFPDLLACARKVATASARKGSTAKEARARR